MVTTDESCIYVTGASKSLSVFRYNGNELTKLFGDEMARSATSHLIVDIPATIPSQATTSSQTISTKQRIILLASENNRLAAISSPQYKLDGTSAFINSRTLINTSLAYLVTRLSIAPLRPPWLQHIANPPGVIGPDIIGTSPAGALTHIRVLDTRASHLLKYLQNLVSYDNMGREATRINASFPRGAESIRFEAPIIDPIPHIPSYYLGNYHASGGRISSNGTDSGEGLSVHNVGPLDPSTFAIDGNMIEVFVRENAEQKLLDMLQQATWETLHAGPESDVAEESERNGNAKEQRLKRFRDIIEVLLGETSSDDIDDCGYDDVHIKNEDDMDFDGEDPGDLKRLQPAVRRCVEWLRDIWQFL
jgi:hypothetical protein